MLRSQLSCVILTPVSQPTIITMKSQNEEEVQKLAQYTATRILDQLLAGNFSIEYSESLTGSVIYKVLKNGQTKDIIFNNLDLFDMFLNTMVFNRIVYLMEEGFVVFDEQARYRVHSEKEMEQFLAID
jgi:hypothetical protein